jgi:hypothetical protein
MDEQTHHYVYGSGLVGCLYDSGPHCADTLEEAIEGALWAFDDLPESELATARENLTTDGIHYFSPECRRDAGADYVEVSRMNGPRDDSEKEG